jgi:uncharacterized protein (DUF1501 family)
MDSMFEKTGMTRRNLLKASVVSGAGALTLSSAMTALGASSSNKHDRAVIFLMMVGGPSALETFDPKPDATREVRGPFGSISTAVPGIRVGEHLPELARRMKKVSIIRSLHHDASPIHETGLQLLQTGQLCRTDDDALPFGSVIAGRLGQKQNAPSFAILPGPIGHTGVAVPRGQAVGNAENAVAPRFVKPTGHDLAYGQTSFGKGCLEARRLVESGARAVVVNMYQTVFNTVSWDSHGTRGFATMDDLAREVIPTFDRAYSALIDDLEARGLLDSTLIVATGEFGRTPKINEHGGRDHWTGDWSGLIAGGKIPGGQLIGQSDRHAAEPVDQPVQPIDLIATIYEHMGINDDSRDQGRSIQSMIGNRVRV